MKHEFLLEIGSEEIPAGYIMPALESMKRIMTSKLDELGLSFKAIRTAATPRRLALCVEELADSQPDREKEIMGPPKKAAFDKNNQPTKAAQGFARSRNATLEDIQVVTTAKGDYLMLRQEIKGKDTPQLLAELLPYLIKAIPFPKSMHWGANRSHFARPIQWLLALFNSKVIPFQIDGLASSDQTCGHRFMSPEFFQVHNFNDYLTGLAKAHVLAEPSQRRRAVVTAIQQASDSLDGHIIPDQELLDTVTNLLEQPEAIAGDFDEKFLRLPREVLITSMRVHQKYFPVADNNGNLLPHFVAVNNTKVKNKDLTRQGHQRVLRARLEDGLFFFNEDRRHKLIERIENLGGVVFQAKLGTMLDKTDRITKLAGWLARNLVPEQQEIIERTAFLAKADLVTDMVNEFPTLQGTMGMHYARLDGEDEAVAKGIMEHYMPLRSGSPMPVEIPGAIVSLADRLDTIVGCFGIGQTPTGGADPFGLRRQTLGMLHIIEDKAFSLSLSACIKKSMELYGDRLHSDTTLNDCLQFIQKRYANDLTTRDIPAEAVAAVLSVDFDDVTDCGARITALATISGQPAFTLLAGSFKRVRNIIKDYRTSSINENLLAETGEKALFSALERTKKHVLPLVAEKEYDLALTEILLMKDPIDTFFDDVMVMVENQKLRENRLSLLAGIADLFLKVGDFSKMYTIATDASQDSISPCMV